MIEIALLVTSILCGMMNAVAGGGVLFVLPVLLFSGLSPLSAAMTTTLVAFPGAGASAYGYRKDLKRAPKRYFWLIIPCAIGGGIGAYLLTKTPAATFESILPWLVLFSVLLFAFQPQLHAHIHKPKHMRKTSPLLLLTLFLFPVALYGGYFGAGFGFIVLAILSFTHLKNMLQINGMKNIIVLGISAVCMVIYSLSGHVVWSYAPLLITGSMIGGMLGSLIAHHISPHASRAAVVSTGFSVVGMLFLKVF